MLRVSRKSWHYKVWKFYHGGMDSDKEPKNLCRYFWACFFGITLPTIAGILALLGISLVLYLMGTHLMATGIVIGSITLIIVLLVGLVYGQQELKKWRKERRKRHIEMHPELYVLGRKKRQKEPSLFWSFVKAKKQKVCPMIEVID